MFDSSVHLCSMHVICRVKYEGPETELKITALKKAQIVGDPALIVRQ